MPRSTEPALIWNPFDWSSAATRALEQSICAGREKIAESLNLSDATEIDSAVNDLCTLAFRAAAFRHEVDRTASVSQQRVNIEALRRSRCYSRKHLDRLDPATFNRIMAHYPGGALAYQAKLSNRTDVARAMRAALDELGCARRGKPAETDSLALKQMALEIAEIFHRYTGRLPGRRVDWKTKKEFGPFLGFVDVVLKLLPAEWRVTRNGGQRGPSHIAKLGAAQYKRALKESNPSRRWTIDESLYLGHQGRE